MESFPFFALRCYASCVGGALSRRQRKIVQHKIDFSVILKSNLSTTQQRGKEETIQRSEIPGKQLCRSQEDAAHPSPRISLEIRTHNWLFNLWLDVNNKAGGRTGSCEHDDEDGKATKRRVAGGEQIFHKTMHRKSRSRMEVSSGLQSAATPEQLFLESQFWKRTEALCKVPR